MTDDSSGSEGDGPTEFPSNDEVPEHSMTPADISPFSVPTDEFDDINELATAEWKSTTTADERIRAVIKRTTQPKTAKEVAETAAVSETKARTTLNKLAEEGIVRAHQTASGKTYERDPDWYLLQQIHQLATSDTLVEQIQRIKRELSEYQSQYGTEEPEEVLISDRELTEAEFSDLSHWRTAKREFNYLRAAYRLKQARVADTRIDASSNGEIPDPRLLR